MAAMMPYLGVFLEALLYTLELSAMSIAGGTLLGVVCGFLSAKRPESPRWAAPVRVVITIYVQLFRSIPPLVLLFLLYFGVSAAFNVSFGMTAAVVVALSLFIGAYQVENVRAGIESVPRGQSEAAVALGLGLFDRMRFVEARAAFRVSFPSMVGQWIVTVKDTTLASGIGVVEATSVALTVRQATGETWLVFLVLGAVYYVINRGVAFIGSVLESRIDRTGRRRDISEFETEEPPAVSTARSMG